MNKHIIWATTLFLSIFILCGTLIYINNNSWTLRMEMDNNTKEAFESIEWDSLDYNYNETKFDNMETHNYTIESISCTETLLPYIEDCFYILIKHDTKGSNTVK